MRNSIAISLLFLLPAARGQDVAPPPKPADGPSLEATLKFIEEKITDEGKFTWTTDVTDTAQNGGAWTNTVKVEISDAVSEVKSCGVSFRWQSEMNGLVIDSNNYTINFKDVRSVVVMPQEQNQAEVDRRSGHPTWTSKITPAFFTLVAHRPKGLENAFLFSDESLAGRVAKAMVHAIELCGGQGDPF